MVFGWMRGGKPSPTSYCVWRSRPALFAGLQRRIESAAKKDAAVIVVAHFADSTEQVAEMLDEAGFEWEALVAQPLVNGVASGPPGQARVYLLHSDIIEGERLDPADVEVAPDRSVTILAAELAFDQQRDEQIDLFARAIATRSRVEHHAAVDDHLVALFIGPSTMTVLEALGFDDSEPIEHQMLRKSIAKARRKLAAVVTEPQPAESAEEWIRVNLDERDG